MEQTDLKKYYFRDFAKRNGFISVNESFDNQGYEEHTHDFFEIVYIKKGQGSYRENNKRKDLCWGDVILVTPRDRHSLQPTTGDFAWINCLFLPSQLYQALDEDCTAAQMLSLPCFPGGTIPDDMLSDGILIQRKYQEFQGLMLDMLREYYRAKQGFEDVLQALLHILLIKIKRNIKEIRLNGSQDCSAESFIRLVDRFLPESSGLPPFDLSLVAQAAGLTPKYFSEAFKKKVGVTFSEYVRNKRLEMAAYMLVSGTANVKSIMEYVGYSDYKTFYKLFKRKYSMTPAAYRKKAQAAGKEAENNHHNTPSDKDGDPIEKKSEEEAI